MENKKPENTKEESKIVNASITIKSNNKLPRKVVRKLSVDGGSLD